MLSDEAFRAQLLDYVYGTLADTERAAFERALEASPALRDELARLEATLGRARMGLAALAEDPPAHVRAAVITEARRAAERGNLRPLRRVHTIRRTAAWLIPALGVAAAVSVVVLQEGDEAGAPVRTRDAIETAPAPAPMGGASAPTLEEEASEPAREHGPREEGPGSGGASSQRPRAAPSAKPKGAAEGLGGAAPASSGARRERARGSAGAGEAAAPAPTKAEVPAAHEVADEAAPPPPIAPSASSVGAEKKRAARDQVAAPDADVQRAERLVREGRVDEAATAYRALLARHPGDARADAWRAQLTRLRAPFR